MLRVRVDHAIENGQDRFRRKLHGCGLIVLPAVRGEDASCVMLSLTTSALPPSGKWACRAGAIMV
jgi:hypothetical protein